MACGQHVPGITDEIAGPNSRPPSNGRTTRTAVNGACPQLCHEPKFLPALWVGTLAGYLETPASAGGTTASRSVRNLTADSALTITQSSDRTCRTPEALCYLFDWLAHQPGGRTWQLGHGPEKIINGLMLRARAIGHASDPTQGQASELMYDSVRPTSCQVAGGPPDSSPFFPLSSLSCSM
jgi:hypothetical protein